MKNTYPTYPIHSKPNKDNGLNTVSFKKNTYPLLTLLTPFLRIG